MSALSARIPEPDADLIADQRAALDALAEHGFAGDMPSAPSVRSVASPDAPGKGSTATTIEWPDPKPVVAEIEPVPYPIDALPAWLRDAVLEVQGHVQAPVELVALIAHAALSIAGQGRIDVERDTSLTGPTTLFLIALALSGERKTEIMKHFMGPLAAHEADERAKAAGELKTYRTDSDAHRARCAGLLAKIKADTKAGKDTAATETALRTLQDKTPVRPRVPRMLLGDETPESLIATLATEWPAVAIVSDEGGLIFGSHGMGRDSVTRNLSTLNSLWSGSTVSVGRRTSESFTVADGRVCVAIQIQPATLAEFLERSGVLARGSGFFARFLLVYARTTQGTRFYRAPPTTWPKRTAFEQRVRAVLAKPVTLTDAGGVAPIMVRLDKGGKAAWIAYHDAVEVMLGVGGDLESVRDVASKSAENAARIAALWTYFERADAADPITRETMTAAGRVASWHLLEAQRYFGELAVSTDDQNAALLDGWLIARCREHGIGEITKRDARQLGPNPIRNDDRLSAALDRLEMLGRARLIVEGQRVRVLINPAVLAEPAGDGA